jgi:hypothetical protein
MGCLAILAIIAVSYYAWTYVGVCTGVIVSLVMIPLMGGVLKAIGATERKN